MLKKLINVAILFFVITTSANADDKLIVLLDWFANPNHAPLFVAQAKGFFKKEHLKVELIGPADPADPPKLVAAKKADIAITYEPQFISQVDKGLPLIRIGTLIDHPLNCLAVLKDGPIKKIPDLKGKRIGYSDSATSSITLKTMLQYNGLTLNDIEHINVHYSLLQGLLAHKIDAASGLMRTFEVIEMELLHKKARLFLPEKNGIPTYSELIYVIHKKNISDSRLPRFLHALQVATFYLKKHPEQSWQAFVKLHPELNNQLNYRAFYQSLPYFTNTPSLFNKKEWAAFIAFMYKNKLINNNYPVSYYAKIIN